MSDEIPTLDTASPLDLFLYGTEKINPNSSYAEWFRYEKDTRELVILYYDGQEWGYEIGEDLARDFYAAGSKGEWCWSHIRIKGEGNARLHQVPATRRR